MARSSDAAAAVTMAVVGIVLLVLWRNGTLRRLTTPLEERYSDIAGRGAAPRMTAVDVMPGAGGAPHIAANGSRASAPAGVPTNGFTPMGPVAASTPLFMRIDDPVVPTMKVAADLTSVITALPDSFEDRHLAGGEAYALGGRRFMSSGGTTVPSSAPPVAQSGGGTAMLEP